MNIVPMKPQLSSQTPRFLWLFLLVQLIEAFLSVKKLAYMWYSMDI